METNLTLPQKYIDLGFAISRFGTDSSALRFQDRMLFIFGSCQEVGEDYISRLCDHYLKLFSKMTKGSNTF
jgi:hypothetical protein